MNEALPRTASQPALSVLAAPSADWDRFVLAQQHASVYLLSGWAGLARDAFGHRAFFVEARDATDSLVGVLALVQQRGVLGNFLTSLPFFNYGGALAADEDIAVHLMQRGRQLAQELGSSYVEYRDAEPRRGDWSVRTDKVSMILSLPDSVEALSKQLGSKLRSQIKRAEREQATVRVGGGELLDAFYEVFAVNMRDLGTPVYPIAFFRALLSRFADKVRILVIDHAGRPAATGLLIMHSGRAEIPWAACLAEAKPLGFNMRLYWEVLRECVDRGCTSFDFGRSTLDSGTYRFKKQWGAQPLQLYWHRWEPGRQAGESAIPMSAGRGMQLATALWKRLPVRVANVLGPWISPGLPW